MANLTSKDGTTIAYDQQGAGPAVILVDGAMGYRSFGKAPELAGLLAPHFSVTTYDRRGRGESSDTKPFAVEREIDDIEALMSVSGGSAYLYGISSGACLCLEAALKLGRKVGKLAMYEPPYDADPTAQHNWKVYRKDLAAALAAGRPGEAVTLFMRLVGVPAEQIDGMRQAPMWPMLEAVAPTLPYDAADIGEDRSPPLGRAARLTMPVLVMDGGANLTIMPFMGATATALAKAIPHAQHRTLEGQTHDVDSKVLAPVLIEFFSQ
jgi:pimeloyl-ACP methyl ester carboxylesterase